MERQGKASHRTSCILQLTAIFSPDSAVLIQFVINKHQMTVQNKTYLPKMKHLAARSPLVRTGIKCVWFVYLLLFFLGCACWMTLLCIYGRNDVVAVYFLCTAMLAVVFRVCLPHSTWVTWWQEWCCCVFIVYCNVGCCFQGMPAPQHLGNMMAGMMLLLCIYCVQQCWLLFSGYACPTAPR